MICGRKEMDEFCILCMKEDISDCYKEELNKSDLKKTENKVINMEKNEFKNKTYKAMIGELERLEIQGTYNGNGHHLAQRLCEMLWSKFKE